ncbi:cation:proton antiporter regulatory subunit [Streptomyces sp. NPDC007818]|uniref:cation:proton antiporter regulatory subunit n=1 Tax=Streptomyces sp. NPDC007818 TaxID=3364780 RepID=UPI00368AFDA2
MERLVHLAHRLRAGQLHTGREDGVAGRGEGQQPGKPLGQSQVHARHGVTVVGIKRPGEDCAHATAETVVAKSDIIVVTGMTRAVEAFTELPCD